MTESRVTDGMRTVIALIVGLTLGGLGRFCDDHAKLTLEFLNSGVMIYVAGALSFGLWSKRRSAACASAFAFLMASVIGYYGVFRYGPGRSDGFWPPIGAMAIWVLAALFVGPALGWIGSLAHRTPPRLAAALWALPSAFLLSEALIWAHLYPVSAMLEIALALAVLIVVLLLSRARPTHLLVGLATGTALSLVVIVGAVAVVRLLAPA